MKKHRRTRGWFRFLFALLACASVAATQDPATDETTTPPVQTAPMWPTMEEPSDQLDAQALKEGLEASGLNVQVIDEHTDFSKLPSLGALPCSASRIASFASRRDRRGQVASSHARALASDASSGV